MKRYRAWRNRLTSEVAVVGGFYWRVTRRRGRIVGIEQWEPTEHVVTQYIYRVWKGDI